MVAAGQTGSRSVPVPNYNPEDVVSSAEENEDFTPVDEESDVSEDEIPEPEESPPEAEEEVTATGRPAKRAAIQQRRGLQRRIAAGLL